ncbi:glucosamine 6-phosphate n-acetyltransferase [Quercus suber]|uniref:Glucosamine 6-phosphate N-acetyltransferase n=1 Tax=Quercus suber TaxID=58331 RepID=A0AAW0KQ36_QUESU
MVPVPNNNSSSEEQKFQVRKLQISDKNKGFIELLRQLTICDSVSDKDFEDRFRELSALGDDHIVSVVEDESSGKIIATGSIFIEKKFLRNCGKVGHIEDVAVDSNARGLKLGKKIIAFLTEHAHLMGCYKLILLRQELEDFERAVNLSSMTDKSQMQEDIISGHKQFVKAIMEQIIHAEKNLEDT